MMVILFLLNEEEALERMVVLLNWSEDLFWAFVDLYKCRSSLLYASMMIDLRFCFIFFLCDLVIMYDSIKLSSLWILEVPLRSYVVYLMFHGVCYLMHEFEASLSLLLT